MKTCYFTICFIFLFQFTFAQEKMPPHLVGKIKYPAVNVHMISGVIDMPYTAFKYDPELDYKVVIDAYDSVKDSTQLLIPIRETARIFNLNIANGVPKEKLKMATVVHWLAVNAILSKEEYEKKYGVPNPNADAIKQLSDLGVKFYVCAQNLGMMNLNKNQLLPEIEVALSAKSAFMALDQMGYTFMDVNEDQ